MAEPTIEGLATLIGRLSKAGGGNFPDACAAAHQLLLELKPASAREALILVMAAAGELDAMGLDRVRDALDAAIAVLSPREPIAGLSLYYGAAAS